VTLNGVAPAGGVVVSLLNFNSFLATVPSTVTVPEGASSANYQMTTSHTGTARVTARLNSSHVDAPYTIF
jgi:hypothetical protein